jgi:hypothetical protein
MLPYQWWKTDPPGDMPINVDLRRYFVIFENQCPTAVSQEYETYALIKAQGCSHPLAISNPP